MLRFSPRQLLSSFAVTLVAVGVLSSCAEKKDRVDWKGRLIEREVQRQAGRVPVLEPAEQAATLGEMLLTPTQLTEADAMFDRALSLDPAHPKANLYSAILKPLLALKGITKRFSPMLGEAERARLVRVEQSFAGLHPKFASVATRLTELAESERLATPALGQAYLRTHLLPLIEQSIAKLKHVEKEDALELRISAEAWVTNGAAPAEPLCQPSANSENPWQCGFRAYSEIVPMKLDGEDRERLRRVLTAWADHLRLTTAYGLESAESFKSAFESRQAQLERNRYRLSPSGIVQILRQFGAFGKLTDANLLSAVAGGEESERNAFAFSHVQTVLCSGTRESAQNVLVQGLCAITDVLFPVEETLAFRTGIQTVVLGTTRSGQPVTARMDLASYLKRPAGDLKTLFPVRFDSRGEPISGSTYGSDDLSLGGLFPDRDYLEKMKQVKLLPTPRLPGALPLRFESHF